MPDEPESSGAVLSPAEELGLRGVRLTARVRRALYCVPAEDLARVHAEMREASVKRHLVYFHEGRVDPVRTLPCPIAVLPEELTYLHRITGCILHALKRLPELFLTDADVRALLRLEPEEERWLRECWGPAHRIRNPVFGRLDAMIDYPSPMWKESLWFIEPNLTGIGGLYLIPAAEELVTEFIVPLLQAQDPDLGLKRLADARDLLARELLAQLEAVGRSRGRVCFVEPKYELEGPDEQRELVRWIHERYGIELAHADPAELQWRDGEAVHDGRTVDLVYRDYSILDLIELEREGADVRPMRQLFRENRVVSSIGAELDHKSCWEVLTNPRLCEKYFSPDEQRVFRRHVLWTRILSDRRTALPGGDQGDLLEYARREQEILVLKPNRGYGGEGVLIGHTVERSVWEAALDAALADEAEWVVQRLATIPVVEFPTLAPDGTLLPEPFYTVMGFLPGEDAIAILARASQRQVVNVAQRGGLCVVLQGR